MARKRRLLTDDQWGHIEPLLPKTTPGPKGAHPRCDNRKVLEGILWILRAGARWQDLPKKYPSPSTCWRRLQQWKQEGLWLEMWRALLSELDEQGHLDWSESFADGSFASAPKGAVPWDAEQLWALDAKEKRICVIEKALAAQGIEVRPASAGEASAVMEKPDYSKLVLKGDGHRQDSFSLTVQAAAKLLGIQADYETIYALSTNGFGPCLDPEEPAKAWWATATGRDTCLDVIAGCIGLNVRKLPARDDSNDPAMPEQGPARERWFAEYARKPLVPVIDEALALGEVVITCREWAVHGPHGFNPWWWGIVVGAREDGTVLGAALNGHHENPFLYVTDLAKQRTHAEEVLRPLKSALMAAADEMAKALAVAN